jgi:hypothetical protein
MYRIVEKVYGVDDGVRHFHQVISSVKLVISRVEWYQSALNELQALHGLTKEGLKALTERCAADEAQFEGQDVIFITYVLHWLFYPLGTTKSFPSLHL